VQPLVVADARDRVRRRRELQRGDLIGDVAHHHRALGEQLAVGELQRRHVALRVDREPVAIAIDELLGAQIDAHHLERQLTFPDFKSALRFVNQVGNLAEDQGHHPDITLAWGKVGITIWTHKIDGLTESDFILAAKIDRL